MSPTETKSPEITRAAERYLEQYGEPLVMNTYLKITVLVLAAVCLMLGALTYKSQRALVNMKPFIVRISDTGRAEAIDYRELPVQTAGGGEQVLPGTVGHALLPAQPLHHRTRPDRRTLLPQRGCPARRHRARAEGQDHLEIQLRCVLALRRYRHQEHHPGRSPRVAIHGPD